MAKIKLTLDYYYIANIMDGKYTKETEFVESSDIYDYIVKNNDIGITRIKKQVLTYTPNEEILYLMLSDKLNSYMNDLIIETYDKLVELRH